jgi:hypothetical protein
VAVAAALTRRWAWPLAGAAAFAFLVAAAMHGQRRDPMQDFRPAGVLTAFAPEDAREVEITLEGKVWRFRRDGEWRSSDPSRTTPADLANRIDTALRLLRNSAPLRVLTADEAERVSPSEYGLGLAGLGVEVRAAGGAVFRIQFGRRNPLGSARYAKVGGMAGVPLMPTHVGEAWEQVIAGPGG